jgi:16S rRNA (guanine527-N7)-methyltransferase
VSAAGAGPVEHAPGPATLLEVLTAAQRRGFIGGQELEAHVRQAEALAEVVGEDAELGPVLDLGSGGGLPGLVLAVRWPSVSLTLLDGSSERGAFLQESVDRMHLADRVDVAIGRAEALGHEPARRGRYAVVVARLFGPPPVVAECGAPFVAVGGRLIVSEPPGSDGARWAHPDELATLGLVAEDLRVRGDHRFQVLRAAGPCPDRYPRRTGVPTKRPLF